MNRSTACVFGLGLAMLLGCDDMADQQKQKVYAPQVGPATVPSNTVEFQEQPAQPPSVTLKLTRARSGSFPHLLRALSFGTGRWERHDRPARLSVASILSHRPAA